MKEAMLFERLEKNRVRCNLCAHHCVITEGKCGVCQSQFPAVGEVLEPFTTPHIIEGWMRGSHYGPLMPVPLQQATPSRFDGLPRVIALGFQLSDGHLIGPRDMLDDPGSTAPGNRERLDKFRARSTHWYEGRKLF